MLPSYIPDGFYPSTDYGKVNETEKATIIEFRFKNEANYKINYMILEFKNQDEVMVFGMPNDKHNIIEKDYGGFTVVISKEDQQYRAAFMKGLTQYSLSTYDLDYSLAERIVDSIFN